jgi:hypothetical protein
MQKQLRPNSVLRGLSALRSVHVDRRLPLEVFDNKHIGRLVDGGHRLIELPSTRKRLPISKKLWLSCQATSRRRNPPDLANTRIDLSTALPLRPQTT